MASSIIDSTQFSFLVAAHLASQVKHVSITTGKAGILDQRVHQQTPVGVLSVTLIGGVPIPKTMSLTMNQMRLLAAETIFVLAESGDPHAAKVLAIMKQAKVSVEEEACAKHQARIHIIRTAKRLRRQPDK